MGEYFPLRMPENVFGYARVSSPNQVRNGRSLDLQMENIKRFGQQMGIDIRAVYVDAGISGYLSIWERPQGHLLMNHISSARGRSGIVCCNFDRLARDAEDFGYLFDEGVSLLDIYAAYFVEEKIQKHLVSSVVKVASFADFVQNNLCGSLPSFITLASDWSDLRILFEACDAKAIKNGLLGPLQL